ncbi:MAG: nickel pincer cofactor biosynthesis protein LarB [Planctomycetes bacterium]|nr:nickel pincer cofactor biosynthesis protein LarB [Planctomycetota bacterium]
MTGPRREAELRALLDQVRSGALDVEAALARLRGGQDLGFAVVDHDRLRRCGFAEVVYCQGKTPDQAAQVAAEIRRRAPRVLLTRATAEHHAAVHALLPDATWHAVARCITSDPEPLPCVGRVALVAAGTSDLPVLEEARVTASILGAAVESFVDLGVAGLHRLLARLPEIRRARVVVVAAGMEGALPSVLAGLLDRPVIAVPTSQGYGAHFGGLAPLLAMLNACAAGVSVVNIDNGFGAGYLAALINRGPDTP